tara:strand:- start:461 stop:1525 length:1065 start_codon:yes stop_codon:yes gene_type:complete
MAQIDKPNLHFNTKLYTGNNSVRTETGVGFQPDWVWIKDRTQAGHNHNLLDVVRGAPKIIMSDSSAAQITDSTDGLTAFTSDGFSLGANTSGTQSQELNKNGNNYAAWCWKAGGGQGSSNTSGTINTTYTSVNTTAGFSISQYTGNGTSGATVGHGLGAVPKMIIVKALSTVDNWAVYHASLGAEKYIELNLQAAQADSTALWNDTEPTSSVFSIGNNSGVNTNGNPYIAYCFAEKKGFSRFSEYEGNTNANGTFVYTGFKPAFVMVKPVDASDNWVMFDNKRIVAINDSVSPHFFYANSTAAEISDSKQLDLLSNGFKMRDSGNTINRSSTFVYWAFAENPIVGSNDVPAVAG